MVRIVMFILIPLNLVSSLVLAGGGVIQNLNAYDTAMLVEPVAFDADGAYLEGADIDVESGIVTVDGEVIEGATVVTEQFLRRGPQPRRSPSSSPAPTAAASSASTPRTPTRTRAPSPNSRATACCCSSPSPCASPSGAP